MKRQLILHVENDPDDVFLVQRAFRDAFITAPVQVVEDGRRATEYLSGEGSYSDRQKYPLSCLIFLDLNLPRMNGTEFLGWLREQPVLKRIPVIVFTSSQHPGDIDSSFELGASSYMVKPFSYKNLLEQVRAFKQYWLGQSELPDMRHAISEPSDPLIS